MELLEGCKYKAKELAQRPGFGLVLRCPDGCVHIVLNNGKIRLTEEQYWMLIEMLSESSIILMSSKQSAARLSLQN
jgi:hypothetical protein